MPLEPDLEKEMATDIESAIDEKPTAPRREPTRSAPGASPDDPPVPKGLVVEKFPESDLENGLVGWDSQEDPANPRNFPPSQKWKSIALLSAITFLSPLISTMSAPGVSYMDEDLHNTSPILASLSVSIFVLGFSAGPLILSPLSEIYGRQPVLNLANACLTLWQIGCALAPNIGSLIGFRFLAGVGGSACLSIGGGMIADLFPIEQRGQATAAFSFGALFGPVLGSIFGGFIAQRASWRWPFWVSLCAAGFFTVGNVFLNMETNHAILIQRKTAKLRKELGRPELQSAYDAKQPDNSKLRILSQGAIRPLRILFRAPILVLLATYLAFLFGLLYLLFTTLTTLYLETYHWQVELCGLAYLGMGVGFFVGLIVVARTSDATVVRLTKANKGVFEPEMRLASCLIFSLFVPISFFWYGWSAHYHVHWIVPIIGLVPFGFGGMGIMLPIQTYFIDVGGTYAASTLAGLTAFRCLFGAFLPLAGPSMYSSLGLGWGNSLLGFISLGLIPVPAIIFRYGGVIRKRWPIQFD